MARKTKKVVRLSSRQRRNVTTLSEAMADAIAALGGQAAVWQVRAFVQTYYGHRGWKDNTIRSYFSAMSRAPKFARVTRGVYINEPAKTKAKARIALAS